jgi:peptidoglycan hydrolase-like protein with peptidoglycan-binding domain
MQKILTAAVLAGTLALPGLAMAQAAGGAAGGGNAGGGAGTEGNYAVQALPSQRLAVTQPNGRGAALTISSSGVREVQQVLNRLGYAAGTLTGNWDQGTQRAMAQFQAAHGLEPTGNLDTSSIAALGLWPRLIGNPLGNGNQSLVANATGAPPPRGNEVASGTAGSGGGTEQGGGAGGGALSAGGAGGGAGGGTAGGGAGSGATGGGATGTPPGR